MAPHAAIVLAALVALVYLGSCAPSVRRTGIDDDVETYPGQITTSPPLTSIPLPSQEATHPPLQSTIHYSITATLDMDRLEVHGKETIRFRNDTGAALDALVFRLYANARPIYGDARTEVQSIHVGGVALSSIPEDDATILRLPLPHPLAAGDVTTVTLDFVTFPARGRSGYGILNHDGGVLVLGNWYPQLGVYGRDGWDTAPVPTVGDAVTSPVAEYRVAVNAPATMQLVTTGVTMLERASGSRKLWILHADHVRDFAIAVSDRWTRRSTRIGETVLHYYALPGRNASLSDNQVLGIAQEAVTTYLALFGPYPYEELDIVEAIIPVGGYEFPGLSLIDAAWRQAEAPYSLAFSLPHELAHQWWYGVVGNDVVREPWLDESLSTYAVVLYQERAHGRRTADDVVAAWAREYVPDAHGGPVNQPATAFRSWPTYRGAVYYRGALFWNALRIELGDARFFQLLQRFYTRHHYEIVTAADWLDLAQQIGGPGVAATFAEWGALPPAEDP